MITKLAGWKYICDYEGQHPGYAELDDLPHPVNVRIYGRGNKRKAISKATGKVEFEYEYTPGAIDWLKEHGIASEGDPMLSPDSYVHGKSNVNY